MTIHIHQLDGCAPTPLAHYLKALGILRILGEQADPKARGWWKKNCFFISSALDEKGFEDFFLCNYQPTPLIAPWNGGSGFYLKDNKTALDAIRHSTGPRLRLYREAINLGMELVNGAPESPKNQEKEDFLRAAKKLFNGPLLEWFEAAIVMGANGTPSFPSLLGTGGNDGRLDFTNNFMQRLVEVIDCSDSELRAHTSAASFLRDSFYGATTLGLPSKSVGQFLPGGAGGANSTAGFMGNARSNPWDFILMLEGTIIFRATIVRRSTVQNLPQAASPFCVRAIGADYGSAAQGESMPRGEQWMPIWPAPSTYLEIQALIAEGRCQLGNRATKHSVDFGRAIAKLGVGRGISAFERFGYIERNGQANLAVPIGRWEVQPQPHQNLIDQVAPWMEQLRKAGNDNLAPASISRASRQCEQAAMACCRGGQLTARWQELLVSLGSAERTLLKSPRFTKDKNLRPLPFLAQDWVIAADDGSAEFRLAVAFASQIGSLSENGEPIDPIRRHFVPITDNGRRFQANSDRIAFPADLVCMGDDLSLVASALVHRRIGTVEASRQQHPQFPLRNRPGISAFPTDIDMFLSGVLNEGRILNLARPMMAIQWGKKPPSFKVPPKTTTGALGLYGVFRLALSPYPIRYPNPFAPTEVRFDPAIHAQLMAGDIRTAMATACRRLNASGLRPHLFRAVASPELCRSLAASIAFPINENFMIKLAERLMRPTTVVPTPITKETTEQ